MKPKEYVANLKNLLAHVIDKHAELRFSTHVFPVVLTDIVNISLGAIHIKPPKYFDSEKNKDVSPQMIRLVFDSDNKINIPIQDITNVEVTVTGAKISVGTQVLEFVVNPVTTNAE